MPILNNRKTSQSKAPLPYEVTKKVARYCLPHMLLSVAIPFGAIIIALLMRLTGLINVAEFITEYIAFPLALLSPVIITLKLIYAIKGAFPRKTNDKHNVILSILICASLSFLILEIMFNLSCALLGLYPLNFASATYMRDMFSSSPSAIILFYFTLLVLFITINMMTITAYLMGHKKNSKFNFTKSCLVFILIYVIILILFLLSYFVATFLDIIALEGIQIQGSIFNSSILCSFITFIVVSIPSNLILYKIIIKSVMNIKKELHH